MNSARITSLALAGLAFQCLTTVHAAAPQVEKLYWAELADEGVIVKRANFDGSDQEIVLEHPSINPRGIAIHKILGTLYLCDFGSGTIYQSSLTGDGLTPLVTNLPRVYDLDIDEINGKIYFVQSNGNVGRVGIDGQNLEILHPGSEQGNSFGIAVDDESGFFYYNYKLNAGDPILTARGDTKSGLTTDIFEMETRAIEADSPREQLYFSTLAGSTITKSNLELGFTGSYSGPDIFVIRDLAINSTGQWLFATEFESIYRVDLDSETISLFFENEKGVVSAEVWSGPATLGDPDDLICLTQFEDVWFSINDTGRYENAVHANGVGFQKTLRKQTTVAGDFNADGLTDLAMVTPLGELWFAINQGINGMAPTVRQSDGWAYNDQNGIFAGDFDGDGFSDILQIAADGTITVGWNTGGQITTRTPQGTTAYQYSLQQELLFRTGDVDNDGIDEIIHFPLGGDVTALSYDGATFVPSTIAILPEAHANGFRVPVFGDFNGDHLLDLAITPADEDGIFVGLRHESGDPIQDFTFWSPRNGLKNGRGEPDPGRFWWLFAADVNGDEKDDLVQLNDTGEIWIAPSTGSSFLPPYKDATLGFEHNPYGPWLLFVGNAR